MFSALFAGHILNGSSAKESLEKTISSVYEIMKNTFDKNKRELDIISSQESFISPKKEFKAEKV